MPDLNALTLAQLFDELVPREVVEATVRRALSEDLGDDLGDGGDVTTSSLADTTRDVDAALVARQEGVIAGIPLVGPVLAEAASCGAAIFEPEVADGDRCAEGQRLGRVRGALATVLGTERTVLNLLGRLGGVATTTREFVDSVTGTRAAICDTRKTTPGLRRLEKYAVRCGGGTLHRVGLFDAALFKDNHLSGVPLDCLTRTVTAAARRARSTRSLRFVEVEVDSLEQLERILAIEPGVVDIVLLDNMSASQLREAVALRDRQAPTLQLEASGTITLATVRTIAETGVDRISVGAITHSAPVLDLGLDLEQR